jgi:hypothetical protein
MDSKHGLPSAMELLLLCRRVYVSTYLQRFLDKLVCSLPPDHRIMDALEFLYSEHTFQFEYTFNIIRFFLRVPLHRLGAITKLELDRLDSISQVWETEVPEALLRERDERDPSYNPTDWMVLCTHILPRMQGLVDLKVNFDPDWFFPCNEKGKESEKVWMPQLLQAVSGMEHLKVFEILLDRADERFKEAWEDKDVRLKIRMSGRTVRMCWCYRCSYKYVYERRSASLKKNRRARMHD